MPARLRTERPLVARVQRQGLAHRERDRTVSLRVPHLTKSCHETGRQADGQGLGQLLARDLGERRLAETVDALVPVPLHRRRLRERGFNQAFEIARPVASATGLPLLVHGIRRRANTQPQSLLAAHERYRNLRGAFGIRRSLKGMNVAIIDDVITTGATVNALAASLREAGADEIHAWALARVVPRRGLEH